MVVYVDLGNGAFEPREIKTGIRTDGYVEVLRGLKSGEKVVAAANFLVDSEAQLKGIKPCLPNRRERYRMIAKIIEYSARNKFIVFLIMFFAMVWGLWTLKNTPLDALPDLSDTQVIIYTEWPGRSPDLVEDQITYPITSTLLAAPKVQAVRGFSFLGSSFIYVIFEEGTDIYWARSRILEYLQAVKNKIPADVNPVLGPDATSLGWGFSYAVVDESGELDLARASLASGL